MNQKDQFINSHPLDDYIDHQTHDVSTQNVKQDFEQQFNEQDLKKIDSISQQIKPLDSEGLLSFGTHLQQNMSQFSHQMLDEVQSKDVGPIGDTLNQLMSKLREVNPDDLNQDNQSKLKRLFRRTKASINEVFSRMQSVSSQVDRITIQLDKHKGNLTKDIQLLDHLYEQNKVYFEDVSLYIAAAQRKKQEINANELPKLLSLIHI